MRFLCLSAVSKPPAMLMVRPQRLPFDADSLRFFLAMCFAFAKNKTLRISGYSDAEVGLFILNSMGRGVIFGGYELYFKRCLPFAP